MEKIKFKKVDPNKIYECLSPLPNPLRNAIKRDPEHWEHDSASGCWYTIEDGKITIGIGDNIKFSYNKD